MNQFPDADDVVQVHELARDLLQKSRTEHAAGPPAPCPTRSTDSGRR